MGIPRITSISLGKLLGNFQSLKEKMHEFLKSRLALLLLTETVATLSVYLKHEDVVEVFVSDLKCKDKTSRLTL